MEQIKNNASENVSLILVANKIDITQLFKNRVVEVNEGESLAQKYGIPYLETSAKSNINITELFEIMARQIKTTILDSEDSNDFGKDNQNKMVISKNKEQNNDSGKCSC